MHAQVFGEALTQAGYLPWTVRSRAIHHAGSLAELTDKDLRAVLERSAAGERQRSV